MSGPTIPLKSRFMVNSLYSNKISECVTKLKNITDIVIVYINWGERLLFTK